MIRKHKKKYVPEFDSPYDEIISGLAKEMKHTMNYDRKMIDSAKKRFREIGVTSAVASEGDRAQARGTMCVQADDDHIAQLLGSIAAEEPQKYRIALIGLFFSDLSSISILERLIYNQVSSKLSKWEDQALAELQEIKDGRREAELRDRQQRLQDLKADIPIREIE